MTNEEIKDTVSEPVKKEEEPVVNDDVLESKKETKPKTTAKKTKTNRRNTVKKNKEEVILLDLINKYNVNTEEDFFLKLAEAGFYNQYHEELELRNRGAIIKPSITEDEFKRKLKL